MFYLTMHLTHFIYSYMALDIWLGSTESMKEETHCHQFMGLLFSISSKKESNIYAPSQSQSNFNTLQASGTNILNIIYIYIYIYIYMCVCVCVI